MFLSPISPSISARGTIGRKKETSSAKKRRSMSGRSRVPLPLFFSVLIITRSTLTTIEGKRKGEMLGRRCRHTRHRFLCSSRRLSSQREKELKDRRYDDPCPFSMPLPDPESESEEKKKKGTLFEEPSVPSPRSSLSSIAEMEGKKKGPRGGEGTARSNLCNSLSSTALEKRKRVCAGGLLTMWVLTATKTLKKHCVGSQTRGEREGGNQGKRKGPDRPATRRNG